MSKLTDYVFAEFFVWADTKRLHDPGYYIATPGPLYGGGTLGSDLGFEMLRGITDKAMARHPKDPLAMGRKMDLLRGLFDVIPQDGPQERRLLLAGSLIRYMAELD